MSKTLEELVEECKQFITLYNKNKMERNPAVGKACFIISKHWFKIYKQYVHYKAVRSHIKPVESAEIMHPGPIKNDEYLCDLSNKNLVASGTNDQFEKNYLDKYLKPNVRERFEYKLINQDLWEFLFSKYGGSEIKRYTVPQGTYYTIVETRLKQLSVVLLPVTNLYKGGEALQGLDFEYNVQLSKRKNYLDLKRRIIDCLKAKFQLNLTDSDVRLWKFTDTKEKLVDACQQISERGDRIEVDSINDPDLEINSGVEFPGESLEPYYQTSSNLEDDSLNETTVIVEYRETEHLKFAFQYKKNQRIFIGKCEFCTQKRTLKIECVCKRVRYCNSSCQEKDQRWHMPNCSAQADAELQRGVSSFQRGPRARDGKVGLGNLGNTCYMNSSLQCLSNCYELTKYFLDERFKYDLNADNPLGTSGRLVQAYAKLLNEMWNQDDSVVRPHMFKRILGEYAQQFQGFGQHDSQECINSILDLLSEDLYRKPKKPYVEMTEANGRNDEEASQEAWLKHLVRNESIIVDLFHGQYKSTLVCSDCKRVSITFDPFMTLSLPIPGKKDKIDFFYIPYNISPNYKNYKGAVFLRDSDSVRDFRQQIFQRFGIDESSFIVTIIADNTIRKMVDQNSRIEEMIGGGTVILYQINPNLNPQLPPQEKNDKADSNFGLSEEYTKVVMTMMMSQKNQYSSSYTIRTNNIPRILWVDSNKSLKEVHYQILEFFAGHFEYLPQDKSRLLPFRKVSIDENEQQQISIDEFLALSSEEKFAVAFPGLNEQNWMDVLKRNDLQIHEAPFTVRIKNMSGYMEACQFCGDKRCDGCPLPFRSDASFRDILMKVGIYTNQSFYQQGYKCGKSDVIFEIVWNNKIEKSFFDSFQTAIAFPNQQLNTPSQDPLQRQEHEITLQDCLEEFSKPEQLDKDNMWYCSKCKQHVQATKILEIYKAPAVLVINLKRFKHGRQRFSMYSGGNGKLDTLVDFQIQSLDLSPYILQKAPDGEEYIYDLFGISNHFGGCGGGHYTAFGLNWMDNQWYSFDDSSISKTSESRIVSSSAYNLFYRRRGKINLNEINYEVLKQSATLEDLQKLQAQQNAQNPQ